LPILGINTLNQENKKGQNNYETTIEEERASGSAGADLSQNGIVAPLRE
jgi:hypothetical protein